MWTAYSELASKELNMESRGKKKINFTVEKFDKYYLSNVVMVNISIINHVDRMYPWYDVAIIALHILVFIPVTQSPVLSWDKSDKFQWWGILQNIQSVSLEIVKI